MFNVNLNLNFDFVSIIKYIHSSWIKKKLLKKQYQKDLENFGVHPKSWTKI